ncbi:MAG: hypothetical protein DRP81_06560 [Candidatus Omnitrophota bacterium]|nr:MAG: hypothetical protein DRP81_06560 [Candidatus Omnitrophota bacterium]
MYELAIIGAGAGGIEAAKEAIKNNLKTILIEEFPLNFGGTCLNKGCIPTKLYLQLTKHNHNLENIFLRKNQIVDSIRKEVFSYLDRKGVEILWGKAQLSDKHTIKINKKEIVAENIIIATGSIPKKIIKPDGKKIIFAEDIFNLSSLPTNILIVGGGSIGLEFASFLNNLSKKVVVIEKEEQILPNFERKVSQRLRAILEKSGIVIKTSTTLDEFNLEKFDIVLLAGGRTPNTENLNLGEIGLKTDSNGRIEANEYMQTNIDNIFACGDVTSHKMYAYVAEYQARVILKNILGQREAINYEGISECIFSIPQIAKVGIDEDEAKKANLSYQIIRTNFRKFSSSHVYQDEDGFIKLLIDSKGKILGATIISNYACELISIFSLAIRNHLIIDKIKNCVFTHPTLSEIIPSFLRS